MVVGKGSADLRVLLEDLHVPQLAVQLGIMWVSWCGDMTFTDKNSSLHHIKPAFLVSFLCGWLTGQNMNVVIFIQTFLGTILDTKVMFVWIIQA